MTRARSVRSTGLIAIALALAAVLAAPSVSVAGGPLTLRTTLDLGSIRAFDVILEGSLAYVATEKGLRIVDISDPLAPFVRAGIAATKGNRSLGLAKKGPHIYLAAGRAGMQVIDVSDPDNPRTVTTVTRGGVIQDVAVHPTGPAAYAISYLGELYVWNIAAPAAPVLTQTLGVLHWRGVCDVCLARMRALTPSGGAQANGVSATGNYVTVVDWNYGGFYAWKSDDPLRLTFAGTHRAPVSFRSEIDLDRGIAYILGTYSRTSGVHSIPVSALDPFVATYLGCPVCGFQPSTIPMDGGGIGFQGKYVFYAGGRGYGEIGVVDASDPVNLRRVAALRLGKPYLKTGHGAGIAARGDLLFVAAGRMGLQVYEFPGLSSPAP